MSRLDRFALVLFVVVLAYMLWFVFVPPFVGYANSYDFTRQSACLGLWQFIEGVDKTLGNHLFPATTLLFDGDLRPVACMRSSDNLFGWLITLRHSPGQLLSMTEVGLAKILLLGGGTAVLLWQAGALRLLLAVVFALLFSNWAYLSYANTLYLEFSVLMAGFWVLGAGACLLAGDERPGRVLLGLLMLALLWLGLSKQQYAPLAALLAVLLAGFCWLRWRALFMSAALGTCAVICVVGFSWFNPVSSLMMKGIDEANKTNTYFGAVLPAARDQRAALQQLGLPESCLSAVGSTWYSQQGARPCPQVVQVSRSRLPGLFVSQPDTLLVPLYQAVLRVRPFYPDYLGMLPPASEAESAQKLAVARPLSFTWLLSLLPQAGYLMVLALLALSALLSTLVLVLQPRQVAALSVMQRGCLGLQVLGALTASYALFSSVFGDGYIELIKHAVAFGLGLAFMLAAWPGALLGCIGVFRLRRSQTLLAIRQGLS